MGPSTGGCWISKLSTVFFHLEGESFSGSQSERMVFLEASFFRGYLLNFGGVNNSCVLKFGWENWTLRQLNRHLVLAPRQFLNGEKMGGTSVGSLHIRAPGCWLVTRMTWNIFFRTGQVDPRYVWFMGIFEWYGWWFRNPARKKTCEVVQRWEIYLSQQDGPLWSF